MMRRFLLWLTARLPVKTIGRPGEPAYAEWYHLATPLNLCRANIHHFLGSDPAGVHDHPWGWAISLILCNWYVEDRRDHSRVRRRFRIYFLTGDTFHRVNVPAGTDCWTLFIHGPYVKHWGFMEPHRLRWDAEKRVSYLPSWDERDGSEWIYRARPRAPFRFDPWPWAKDVMRGRDLRSAA